MSTQNNSRDEWQKPSSSGSTTSHQPTLWKGEVLIEVLFSADGEARVIRVLRGLGHGLNEAAIRAAEQIRINWASGRGGYRS